ncbi:MAG: hypothetical protein ACRYGM_09780 [Janthinobacterium lividum]
MDGAAPVSVASSVHRLLLADEIANALAAGRSVALTHDDPVADLLEMVRGIAAESGIQVLSLRPPFDGASFLTQFARAWRLVGPMPDGVRVMPPKGSDKRFVLEINQAQAVPAETIAQLEIMAQAWPGMQLILADGPDAPAGGRLDRRALLQRRSWLSVTVPAAQRPNAPMPAAPRSAALADAAPASGPAAPASPGKPPGRISRVPVWSLSLGALSLLAFLAVPRFSQDLGRLEGRWSAVRSDAVPASPPVQDHPAAPTASVELAAATEPARPSLPEQPKVTAGPVVPIVVPAAAEPVQPVREAAAHLPPPQPAAPLPNRAATAPTVLGDSTPAMVAATTPVTAASTSPVMVDAMTRRGLAMLELGDVSAARLLLARAASAGSGAAAYAMGTTFDAATLERIGAVGIQPNPASAAVWYRLAVQQGDDRGRLMLSTPPTSIVSAKPESAP